MNELPNNICEFSITKLFGKKDITIPFIDNVMIVIGENGQSKSTFLKVFYFVLKGELVKLEPIHFESIRIKFFSETIIITYEELGFSLDHENNIQRIEEIKHLQKRVNDKTGNGPDILDRDEILFSKMENIRNNVKGKLIHFPTYRRVEEDLYKLIRQHNDSNDYDTELFKETLGEKTFNEIIQFGMSDVKKTLDDIIKQIGNGSLYNHYIKLNEFINTCNKYLIRKYFEYDESLSAINLYDENEETIDLSNLSSGEKQIVSIFSKIYLSANDNLIILFDEPELSLSIEWQERILVDIVNTGKCALLFVVTHSPFIFNNMLKIYARSIDSF